jgi:DnaJ family protein C protein 3
MMLMIRKVSYLFAILAFVFASLTNGAATPPTAKELSKMRRQADSEFVSGKKNGPRNALKILNKIIKLEPDNHNNFYKRYRVHLRLKKNDQALSDLESAVKVKPSFTSGWSQHAKLLLKLGRCAEAESSLQNALKINPNHKATVALQPPVSKCAASLRQADHAERRGDWIQADTGLTAALDAANTSPSLLLRRAKVRLHLKKYYEVLADSGKVLKMEKHNLDALAVRARAYYLLGDHEMAMRHQREGLKSDPDHKKIKTAYRIIKKIEKTFKRAEKHEQEGRPSEASAEFQSCATIDPEHNEFNKKAWSAACRVIQERLNDPSAARAACAKALQIDSNYLDALKYTAKTYDNEENWEESVRAWTAAHEAAGNGNADIEDGLRRAQAALKQSKEKNYYKILGVRRDASKREIKKAYRKLALEWHPDKWSGSSDEEKKTAEKKFQDIGEAAEVLGDDEKRGKFDRGEEVFANQGGGGGGNPFQHFQQGANFHFQFRL